MNLSKIIDIITGKEKEKPYWSQLQESLGVNESQILMTRKRQPWARTDSFETIAAVPKEDGKIELVMGIGYHFFGKTPTPYGKFDDEPIVEREIVESVPSKSELNRLMNKKLAIYDDPL